MARLSGKGLNLGMQKMISGLETKIQVPYYAHTCSDLRYQFPKMPKVYDMLPFLSQFFLNLFIKSWANPTWGQPKIWCTNSPPPQKKTDQ